MMCEGDSVLLQSRVSPPCGTVKFVDIGLPESGIVSMTAYSLGRFKTLFPVHVVAKIGNNESST